jgi:ribose 1,5-bisphosphokinase PhnN
LRARGRETEAQIQERIVRASKFIAPADALVIDNSGTLESAVAQWLPLLKQALNHV